MISREEKKLCIMKPVMTLRPLFSGIISGFKTDVSTSLGKLTDKFFLIRCRIFARSIISF